MQIAPVPVTGAISFVRVPLWNTRDNTETVGTLPVSAYPWDMADIVNLNKFRKSKARADKKAQADENAVKFGRSKAEKAADSATVEELHQSVDDHKLDQ